MWYVLEKQGSLTSAQLEQVQPPPVQSPYSLAREPTSPGEVHGSF